MTKLKPRSIPLTALLAVLASASLTGAAPASASPERASAPAKEIVKQIPGLPFTAKSQPRRSYVAAAGSRARFFVSLVVRGGKLAVYLCDGKRVSDWFGGSVRNGRFDVRSGKGTRVRGVIGTTIRGRLSVRGAGSYRLAATRARGGWGLYVGRDTRLRGDYRYRWIRIGNSVRGLSDDGTESTKNGVAITEPGFVGPTSSSTGEGSGVSSLSDLTCSELQSEANRLRGVAAELEKKAKTKWVKSNLSLIYNQIVTLMMAGDLLSPPCDV